MQMVGRIGSEFKIRVARNLDLWIGEKEVRRLSEGTPVPRTVAGSIAIFAKGRNTEVRVALGQKVPYKVNPSEDGSSIEVTLYGVSSNTDWIHYDSTGGVVQQVRWFQDSDDSFRLRVLTPPDSWWGYDARFDGSNFILELRSPPPLAKGGAVLKDLTIAVDAGHSSDIGSIGPTGLLEKDVNLAIAKCLEKKLAAEGAKVHMLREGTENVALYDRPKMAWKAKADILISVHNNALPDGSNPFEKNGYGVYYFHPQSFALAREIHKAYGEILGVDQKARSALRDDGLHYGNLALPRTAQMPSVLTESAYIIVPREEDLLKTEDFQCDCAEAMLRGLKRYVRRMRRIQSGLVKPAWRAEDDQSVEDEPTAAPRTSGKKPAKGEPKAKRR
jgi:N-acetylmuramoyl-L-alanine amidase